MIYSSHEFSLELENILTSRESIDTQQIAAWAYETRLKNVSSIDPQVSDWLLQLGAMDMGAEFEFTREELENIVRVARVKA